MKVGMIFSLAVWFVLLTFTAETEGLNPEFVDILEYFQLPEEETGYYVGALNATDADSDNLIYGIQDTAPKYLSGNPYSNGKQYLAVDPVSGNVTVENRVDRELTSTLRPTWTVTDGSNVITEIGYLIVMDKNDVVPRFEGLQDRLDPKSEDTAVGERITAFSVYDADTGDNGLVDVSNVTEDSDCDVIHPFEIKTIPGERNNFEITVADDLDYSVKSQYMLCLVAEDRAGGADSLKSNISKILIPIRDVQNDPPVFLQLPYNAEIYENNEVLAPGFR